MTWRKPNQNADMIDGGRNNLRKLPPYKEDKIMDNGTEVTIRTYTSTGQFNNSTFEQGDIIYLLNNKYHRVNGPAMILNTNGGIVHRFWINGIKYNDEESFINEVRRLRIEKMLE